jgi:hypothetical protein
MPRCQWRREAMVQKLRPMGSMWTTSESAFHAIFLYKI